MLQMKWRGCEGIQLPNGEFKKVATYKLMSVMPSSKNLTFPLKLQGRIFFRKPFTACQHLMSICNCNNNYESATVVHLL